MLMKLPSGKYFVSHSYRDAAIRDQMIYALPPGVQAYVFPPISVTPDQFVSNNLIEAILACDALIYINEGYSAQSFWVAFERDYALRSGKPVFAYTPTTGAFMPHSEPALDLAVFAIYQHGTQEVVRPILEFMRESRYFDLWIDAEQLRAGDLFAEQLERGMQQIIDRGGYATVFWGDAAAQSPFIAQEVQKGVEQGRVVVAGIDSASMPDLMRARRLRLHQRQESAA